MWTISSSSTTIPKSCVTSAAENRRHARKSGTISFPFHLGVYERNDGLGTWAAQARSTGEFLGWFHLRPGSGEGVELGYRLRRAAWNRGYATEGSRALIRQGFTDLGADRVFALTMTVNTASRRVMEKAGLTLVRPSGMKGPTSSKAPNTAKWSTP
jgi:RimJ/RimL family protein N-acetyltransferase